MPTYVNKFVKLITAFTIIIAIVSFAVLACYGLFPVEYEDTINKYCKEYNVDKDLVLALIKAESNFDKNATSKANAKGLMQITDETYLYCLESLNISESPQIYDPESNLQAGIWYLSFLLKKYNGNTENAIAAYNAGTTNVDKWLASPKYSSDGTTLGTIPFGETKRHIEKIIRYKKIYSILY